MYRACILKTPEFKQIFREKRKTICKLAKNIYVTHNNDTNNRAWETTIKYYVCDVGQNYFELQYL